MLCLYILCARARNNNINEQKKTNRRGNWARLMPGISFDVVDVKHNYAKKIIICYYYRKIRIFFLISLETENLWRRGLRVQTGAQNTSARHHYEKFAGCVAPLLR